MHDHRLIDERSLAFDRLIAARLRSDPALINQARGNLQRWLRTVSPRARPALIEWQNILEGSIEDVLVMLEATDERAVRLRQSSPFCGMFTVGERTDILREFQTRDAIPA